MEKGTVTVYLILGLVIIGVSGIIFSGFFKPSAGPFKNPAVVDKVPTYASQALNLEFQYPKSMRVKEDTEEEFNKRGNGNFRKNFKGYVGYEPGKVLGAVVVLDKDQKFDINPLTIWVFDNPDDLTITGWFNKYWYYPFLWGVFDWVSKGHVTLDQEATVSGQPAKSKIVSYQPGKPKFIYMAKEQKMYLFRIIGETGDKILATFKFF